MMFKVQIPRDQAKMLLALPFEGKYLPKMTGRQKNNFDHPLCSTGNFVSLGKESEPRSGRLETVAIGHIRH